MEISHIAHHYSEMGFGELQCIGQQPRVSDDQQTQINARQDDQFHFSDVKYNKQNKNNKDPDTKYLDEQLHRS